MSYERRLVSLVRLARTLAELACKSMWYINPYTLVPLLTGICEIFYTLFLFPYSLPDAVLEKC